MLDVRIDQQVNSNDTHHQMRQLYPSDHS